MTVKPRKPFHEMSMRNLRRYSCAWCDQRLDRMKRDPRNCSDIFRGGGECTWHERLNQEAE